MQKRLIYFFIVLTISLQINAQTKEEIEIQLKHLEFNHEQSLKTISAKKQVYEDGYRNCLSKCRGDGYRKTEDKAGKIPDEKKDDCPHCKKDYDMYMNQLANNYNTLTAEYLKEKWRLGQLLDKVSSSNGDGFFSDKYNSAGQSYRDAAKKTKCQTRKTYFLQMADYTDCLARRMNNSTTNCQEPTMPYPDCPEDEGDILVDKQKTTINPIQNEIKRQEQTEIEVNNATNKMQEVMDKHIANGGKESGAILIGTIAGAGELSDPTEQLTLMGFGVGLALLKKSAEKKEERRQQILKNRQDAARLARIVESKKSFIQEVSNPTNYYLPNNSNSLRYALLLIFPKELDSHDQLLYFSSAILIPKYSDGTYPSKDKVLSELLKGIPSKFKTNMDFKLVYPITDFQKFAETFSQKIENASSFYFNVSGINLNRQPTFTTETVGSKDFWDEKQKADTIKTSQKKNSSFWDN